MIALTLKSNYPEINIMKLLLTLIQRAKAHFSATLHIFGPDLFERYLRESKHPGYPIASEIRLEPLQNNIDNQFDVVIKCAEKGAYLARITLERLFEIAKKAAGKAVKAGPGGQSEAAYSSFSPGQLGYEVEDLVHESIARLVRAGALRFPPACPDEVEVNLRGQTDVVLGAYLKTTMRNLMIDKAAHSSEYKLTLDEPLLKNDESELTLKDTIRSEIATEQVTAPFVIEALQKAINCLSSMERFYLLMRNLPAFWSIDETRSMAVESAMQVLKLKREEAETRLRRAVEESEQIRGDVLSSSEVLALTQGASESVDLSIRAIDTGYFRASKAASHLMGFDKNSRDK